MKIKLAVLFLLLSTSIFAQKPIKYNLSEDGKQYVKFNFTNQVWIRYNQNNDGSTLFGEPVNNSFDIGLRRTRFVLSGKISPKVYFYTQFGQNNFNALSARKTGTFFHDALAEYHIDEKKLDLGAGLTAWTGLSRFSSPSIGTGLGVDLPLFAQALNDMNDLFLRNLSVYAKGKLGKLDYRFIAIQPMAIQNSSAFTTLALDTASRESTFSTKPAQIQLSGYFAYNFLEQESNETPYTVGTYLGKKKVFNIGAGFKYQGKAMARYNGIDTVSSAIKLFSVDVFYDAPLRKEKNDAISIYVGYFNYDFGYKYLKSSAPMNVTNGIAPETTQINGTGNASIGVGTGQILYLQIGYLLPQKEIKPTRWMPYTAFTYQNFEKIGKASNIIEAGLNIFLNGHYSKLTIGWQSRQQVTPNARNSFDFKRKNGIIFQYQISI